TEVIGASYPVTRCPDSCLNQHKSIPFIWSFVNISLLGEGTSCEGFTRQCSLPAFARSRTPFPLPFSNIASTKPASPLRVLALIQHLSSFELSATFPPICIAPPDWASP